jgi:hypothetical protein
MWRYEISICGFARGKRRAVATLLREHGGQERAWAEKRARCGRGDVSDEVAGTVGTSSLWRFCQAGTGQRA